MVIDPASLDERLEAVHLAPTPGFDGLERLVRRNDDAVPAVLIAGEIAVRRGVSAAALGTRRLGRVLRAGEPAAVPFVVPRAA